LFFYLDVGTAFAFSCYRLCYRHEYFLFFPGFFVVFRLDQDFSRFLVSKGALFYVLFQVNGDFSSAYCSLNHYYFSTVNVGKYIIGGYGCTSNTMNFYIHQSSPVAPAKLAVYKSIPKHIFLMPLGNNFLISRAPVDTDKRGENC